MASRGQDVKADGRAVETRPIVIDVAFLSDDYKLIAPRMTPMTSTGLLSICRLVSKSGEPTFVARWSESQHILKFDLRCPDGKSKLPKNIESEFKHGQNGCSGHHCTPVSIEDGRKYSVRLHYHGTRIFEGAIQFALTFSVGGHAGGRGALVCCAEDIRP